MLMNLVRSEQPTFICKLHIVMYMEFFVRMHVMVDI